MRISKSLKKLLACMMAVIIAAAYMPMAFAEDNDQEPEIIEIATAQDLMDMAAAVNSGEASDASFKLTADIDLGDVLDPEEGEPVPWTAIGTSQHRFTGIFDGDDHIIEGLVADHGLFGYVNGAIIINVTVYGAVTNSAGNLGGIIDRAYGDTMIDCVGNCVNVQSEGENVGGIVGYYTANSNIFIMISHSFNKAAIDGTSFVGGIVGRTSGNTASLRIDSSYNNGAVTTHADNALGGGICGNRCTLANCYNTGVIAAAEGSATQKIFALTGGSDDTPGSSSTNAPSVAEGSECYWLTDGRSRGNGGKALSTVIQASRDEFITLADGVLDELNQQDPKFQWVAGDHVVAEAQDYPGLYWEASLDDQKLMGYLVLYDLANTNFPADDYEEAGVTARTAELTAGEAAIKAAENRDGIYEAVGVALGKIALIPTSDDIDDAIDELQDYVDYDDYYDYQAEEIKDIIDKAETDFKAITSLGDLDKALAAAKTEIDEIPAYWQVDDADEAKEDLEQTMINANSIMASGEYSAESLAVLKDALAKADEIYNDPDAFAYEVTDAKKAVNAALRGLKPGTDGPKSELLNALIGAQAVDAKEYTADSYAALKAAVDKAKALIDDPEATPEALRDAKVAVLEAQKNLVKKSANTMKVKAKKKTVKFLKLWRKKKVVKAVKVKKAKGKVTYRKVGGSKKFIVNKKTGKITVKKRTLRGKYTIKVKVTAAGNDNFLPKSKTVKVKIRVK